MTTKIPAGVAMVNVLKSWGVDHLYGIPGGSFNSIMDALYEEKETIHYIQVRHEETGALAASADAKLTGKIGVCFGSAGPGGTHLLNGLYDAKMDNVPVLALIGQVASKQMNTFFFQEMNENPIYADVAVYNRTVMTPESLPQVVDEAIRQAYAKKGVAVVTIPVDYGEVEIVEQNESRAINHRTNRYMPNDTSALEKTLALIQKAKRPVLYIGQGVRGGFSAIKAFCETFKMPVASTVLAKGIIPDLYKNYLGTVGRVAGKPGNEALKLADLILFVGSNYPFADLFFNQKARYVYVNTDISALGRRKVADVSLLADGIQTLETLVKMGKEETNTHWYDTNQQNIKNWHAWMNHFNERNDQPLRVEPVFAQINRIAEKDAIFITDVGNTTIHAIRHLTMNGTQQFTTSGWFATMGYGVPGGIAGQLSYPDRQIFTLNGDGAFSMAMQDITTQVKYHLPIINIVFSNDSLGFIEAEQEDTKQTKFGVSLQEVDYAKVAEGMGATGYTVTHYDQLKEIFDDVKQTKKPVVIDIKIRNDRPLPVEHLVLDKDQFSQEDIRAFKEKYEIEQLPTLISLLNQN